MCSSNADWLTSGARYGTKWEKCEKRIIKDKQQHEKQKQRILLCFKHLVSLQLADGPTAAQARVAHIIQYHIISTLPLSTTNTLRR